MTDRHQQLAHSLAESLGHNPAVQAVVLHGSVADGLHRDDSDLDLIVLTTDDPLPTSKTLAQDKPWRGHHVTRIDGIQVDTITDNLTGWQGRLHRPVPSWAYAWADGTVLHQRDGAADQLQRLALRCLTDYEPARQHLIELQDYWGHVRPKLVATVQRSDSVETGYSLTLGLPRLIETLFAINSVVAPPASSRRTLARLQALPEPHGLSGLLRDLYSHPDPMVRAKTLLELIDDVTHHLATRLASDR